jgi:uncharacterized protein YjbI with pentapeptide repeats
MTELKPRDVKQLQARWTPERATAARRALMGFGSVRRSAMGEVDGRLDLRGLPAVGLRLLNVPLVRPVRWRRLDLSGADLGDLFLVRGGEFVDCRFDRADCQGWGLFGGTIRGCSFVRADLRDSNMGSGTRWIDVDLGHANLRRTHSRNGRFERVRFDHAGLFRREFSSDPLIDCSFAGLVDDCQFGGPDAPPDLVGRVDFRHATLRYVRFWGQNLSEVRPPEDGDHLVVRYPRCVLDRILASLDEDPHHPLRWLRTLFERRVLELGPRQAAWIQHLGDLGIDGDVEKGRSAGALIRAVEQACADQAP